MSYQDKSLKCADCGATFVWSASEQELFAQRGYTNEPKRCPACRQARKATRPATSSFGSDRAPRQMYAAQCADCGKDTEVPFEPREGRPVYCSDCYSKHRVSRP